MRVNNICLVITILAIQVTSSMATRSVEAALEKQLDKKGYAVLQLKKKRLVLRNAKENDGSQYDSNQRNGLYQSSKPQDSIPADTVLRKKYINRNDMESLANVNLSLYNNRQKRHKGENDDHLQKSEKADLDTVRRSMMAEANAVAAAIESEEVREDIDSENGNTEGESEVQQQKSEVSESDEKDKVNYEDYDNKQEKFISDQLKQDSEDKDRESHSEEDESSSVHHSEKEDKDKESHSEEDSEKSAHHSKEEDKTETRKSGKEAKSADVHQLVKDVGTVFVLLAKAEKNLLEKMDGIKSSLEKSITTLQKAENEMIVKRKRREAFANKALTEVMSSLSKDDMAKLLARSKRENTEGPSRACIVIDVPVSSYVPSHEHHPNFHQAQTQTYSNNVALNWNSNSANAEEEQSGQFQNQISTNSESGNNNNNWNEDSSAGEQSQGYSNSIQHQSQSHSENMHNDISSEDINHEHFQSSISSMANSPAGQDSKQVSEYGAQSMDESIDLSSIFWLKLPTEYNDSFDKKVYSLLRSISHTGRDILLIPVTRSFSSSDDITDGFLRAVHITPKSQLAHYFKYDRQLNIQLIK